MPAVARAFSRAVASRAAANRLAALEELRVRAEKRILISSLTAYFESIRRNTPRESGALRRAWRQLITVSTRSVTIDIRNDLPYATITEERRGMIRRAIEPRLFYRYVRGYINITLGN